MSAKKIAIQFYCSRGTNAIEVHEKRLLFMIEIGYQNSYFCFGNFDMKNTPCSNPPVKKKIAEIPVEVEHNYLGVAMRN